MGALMRAAIDRRHLDLGDVRELHELVRVALTTGSARQVESSLRSHYLSEDARHLNVAHERA